MPCLIIPSSTASKAYAVLPKLVPNSDIPNSDVFLVPNSEERGSVPNSEGSETIPRHP